MLAAVRLELVCIEVGLLAPPVVPCVPAVLVVVVAVDPEDPASAVELASVEFAPDCCPDCELGDASVNFEPPPPQKVTRTLTCE
jgi:hypothetical protein